MQFFNQVLDSDMLSKLPAVVIMVLIDPQTRAEAIEHLNDLGCLAFGQQVDLQVEVIPAIGNHTHSVLFYQYESGEQDRLQWGDRRQQRVRKGIERRDLRNHPGIHDDPAGESHAFKHDEGDRADEAADRICDGLPTAPGLEGFILDLKNFVYILGDGRWCSGLCFIHAKGSNQEPCSRAL
jgi:hypothetical protein